jgi:1,4-dihydroxy-6-naphthoate synthase
MFYAMAESRIDLRGYRFAHILQDIQTLNERATRVSSHYRRFHPRARLRPGQIRLLPSGASMGDGYGPLFIAENDDAFPMGRMITEKLASQKTIAVPGRMTSAFLAAQLFLGRDFDCVVVPFDEIFEEVRAGRAGAGLIIHEGQLTYAQEGFTGVFDLGEW